jgi:prepilin-type N-terminal cleavage/methylation domain-containing protein
MKRELHLRSIFRRNAGVSVIEMAITVTILGILASIAMPSFQSLRLAMALSSAQEDMAATLLRARWKSINLGSGGAGWSVDLNSTTLIQLRDSGGAAQASTDLASYYTTQASSSPSVTPVTTIGFDNRGFLTTSSPVCITLTNPKGAQKILAIRKMGKILKNLSSCPVS